MAGGKKGGRKIGRNSSWCQAYRISRRREKNKRRKLEKHLKRFPDDQTAQEALQKL